VNPATEKDSEGLTKDRYRYTCYFPLRICSGVGKKAVISDVPADLIAEPGYAVSNTEIKRSTSCTVLIFAFYKTVFPELSSVLVHFHHQINVLLFTGPYLFRDTFCPIIRMFYW
jgi:hypothetical protein